MTQLHLVLVNLRVHGSNEEVDGCNEICSVPRIDSAKGLLGRG